MSKMITGDQFSQGLKKVASSLNTKIAELKSSSHNHLNKDILDRLSANEKGELLYNGNVISNLWDNIENKPTKIVTGIVKTETGIGVIYEDASIESIKISSSSSNSYNTFETTEW